MTSNKSDRFSEDVGVEDASPLVSKADFDETNYLHHLNGLDLTPTQKSDLLRVLWDLCRTAVEMDLPDDSSAPKADELSDQERVRP